MVGCLHGDSPATHHPTRSHHISYATLLHITNTADQDMMSRGYSLVKAKLNPINGNLRVLLRVLQGCRNCHKRWLPETTMHPLSSSPLDTARHTFLHAGSDYSLRKKCEERKRHDWSYLLQRKFCRLPRGRGRSKV